MERKHSGSCFFVMNTDNSYAQNTLNDWMRVSFHEEQNQSTSFNKRLSSIDHSTTIAADYGESTSQPCDLIPIRRDQSRKFETIALKWVIKEISKSIMSTFITLETLLVCDCT